MNAVEQINDAIEGAMSLYVFEVLSQLDDKLRSGAELKIPTCIPIEPDAEYDYGAAYAIYHDRAQLHENGLPDFVDTLQKGIDQIIAHKDHNVCLMGYGSDSGIDYDFDSFEPEYVKRRIKEVMESNNDRFFKDAIPHLTNEQVVFYRIAYTLQKS